MGKPFGYSKFQKYISYLLIFSLLFLNTFNIAVFERLQAEDNTNNQLISIIINENIYGSIKSKIIRYAQDIQQKLSNTKVVIFNVPDDISPYKIALLNEKLFYEGDGNKLSQLIGTILIGDIPLPIVHKNNKAFLSIYPYIDFDEKNFVYDISKGYYEATDKSLADPNAEIWHSIIAPNTGNIDTDIKKLNEFFDKDHNFYTKSGIFSSSLQEPYVFYYDGKREELSTSLTKWQGYQLYLENLEDLAYNRYNKHLANNLKGTSDLNQNNDISSILTSNDDMTNNVKKIIGSNAKDTSFDLNSVPDIQTKDVILKIVKQFFEVFNDKNLGDVLKFIYNTGRYGVATDNIRGDTLMTLITKRDLMAKNTLKDTNTLLEDSIDNIVKKGLSRNIAILTAYSGSENSFNNKTEDFGLGEILPQYNSLYYKRNSNPLYKNYLFGNLALDINSASDCNITRGGTTTGSVLVEANRGYNVLNAELDAELLKSDLPGLECMSNGLKTQSFWGGNSPLNIDTSNIVKSGLLLLDNKYKDFVKPIYDIGGSKELKAGSDLKINSPLDCFKNNLILQPYTYTGSTGDIYWPNEKSSPAYSCKTDLTNATLEDYNNLKLENIVNEVRPGCSKTTINIGDLKTIVNYNYCGYDNFSFIGGSDTSSCNSSPSPILDALGFMADNCTQKFYTYNFKIIPSYIVHKSPTNEELGAEYMNMATPSLPSDRDRFIDFISAKGNYAKIEYPNLFRISIPEGKDLTYYKAKEEIKKLLDKKSEEINRIIIKENPNSLTDTNAKIFNILKTGVYPSNIDLYGILSSNSTVLDEVVKNVLWYNYNSATIKYKYIFEHYLDIDGNSDSIDPAHKSDYEIAYLGGEGDSNNMYIKLDPEEKGVLDEEINNILRDNQNLNTLLSSVNVANSKNADSSSEFQCGPPEGTPIYEWIPAIFCWLKTLVPPIVLQDGKCKNCGKSIVGFSDSSVSPSSSKDVITGSGYFEDANKNGIIDGAELIKDGKIQLSLDKSTYSYDSNISIDAKLISSAALGNKLISVDSSSNINFKISKIFSYEDGSSDPKIVYNRDSNDKDLNNEDLINEYINFSPITIRAQEGIAKYHATSKQEDVDIVLDASIETKNKDGNIFVDVVSAPLKIIIRGDSIDIVSKISGEVSSSTEAGNKGILFNLQKLDKNGNQTPDNLSYTLVVYDDISNEKINDSYTIRSASYLFDDKTILDKIGIYKFEFTDNNGLSNSKTITILPSSLTEIKVTPVTTQIVKGNETTVLVELFDKYGNYTKGDLYNITGVISGPATFSKNDLQQNSSSIIEGFAYFTIKSTDIGDISLKFTSSNPSLESAGINLQSIDYAKAQVNIEGGDIIVGKDKHKINISIQDKNNNLLDKFSGIAYFDFPSISGVIEPNYVTIKNGKSVGDVYLVPNFVARENLSLEVNVPGINDVQGNQVTIFPDIPMKVGLINQTSKFEAKIGEKTQLKAVLYDRYGNITFNDIDHKANFMIPAAYQKYINFAEDKYIQNVDFNKGIAIINTFSSEIPGSSFVKVNVTPSLSDNSFTYKDSTGSSISISGISKNATNIETYYLFNKEKLQNINYNSLYTVLLGANYGNITNPGYLGGEILFNTASRSLAVSSVLNNPYSKEIAFSFTPGGKYTSGNQKDDITFNLEDNIISSDKGTQIDFYDSIYKNLIARAWLNLDNNTELISCDTSDTEDLSDCNAPEEKSYIILKGISINNLESTAVKNDDNLSLNFNGYNVFSINSIGQITKDPSVLLHLNTDIAGNLLGIKIISNKEVIGYLGIKFATDQIGVYDSSSFPDILNTNKNQILIEYISSDYSYDYSFLGSSSHGPKGVYFYKSNEGDDATDNDLITEGSKTGLENYSEETGIGWTDKNKILLEFAGGNTVGDSTKFYQTYSMINLGDPIISLEVKKPASGDFDKTIGKKILEGKADNIESYKKIDFNGDSYPDIVIFYESGKIELLANYEGDFKNMGYLAYVVDAGKSRKGVGDFNGDSFGDIAMVDKNGKLIILQNKNAKFTRIDVSKQAILNGAIVQLEVFDMDRDGKDDIITVDDSGELNILYGGIDSEGNISFSKKLVDNSLGLKISNEAINTGGAIFYDGLEPQLPEPGAQEEYYKQSENLADSKNSSEIPDDNMSTIINNTIYYQYKYSTPRDSYTNKEKDEIIQGSVGTDDNGNPDINLAKSISDLQTELVSASATGMTDISDFNTTNLEKTKTFIRSQFAYVKGITVQKKYNTNGGIIKSGNKVEVIITLTNTTGKNIDNFVYLDSNKKIFSEEEDNSTYKITQNGNTVEKTMQKPIDGDYDYIFDNISIPNGESVTISYELTIPVVSFGKMTVGLLDKTDPYGEIALSPSSECGSNQIIWLSPSSREYERKTKTFQDNSQIPKTLTKNDIDNNKNGSADYLDLLQGGGDLYSISNSVYSAEDEGVLLFKVFPSGDTTVKVARYDATENTESTIIRSALPSGKLNDSKTTLTFGKLPSGSIPQCNKITGNPYFIYVKQSMESLGVIESAIVSDGGVLCSFDNSDGYSILTPYTYSKLALNAYNYDANNNGIPDKDDIPGDKLFSLNPSSGGSSPGDISDGGLNSANVDSINSQIDTAVKGLGCGFGGGSCLSLPMNWAPLAPGSSPTIFGFPLTPNLMQPSAGLPAFSMLTWSIGPYCFPIPSVWPGSPLSMPPCSGILGAGGMLGTTSVTNQFRIYITPTITGAVGVAMCFGGPSMSMGMVPPQAVSPLVPGGNCIVAAKPLAGCSDDGSDGDVGSLSSVSYSSSSSNSSGNSFVNANSCTTKNTETTNFSTTTQTNIEKYIRGDKTVSANLIKDPSIQNGVKMKAGPALKIGGGDSEGSNTLDVSVDSDALKNFDFGNIVKISSKRVMAFPDFIMDWVTRQIEEIINKLTSLPTLYIILPDLSGIMDSGWDGFTDNLKKAFDSKNKDSNLGDKLQSNAKVSDSTVKSLQTSYNNLASKTKGTANSAGDTISGIKGAYKFMSNLPLIKFENETVDINIPWISFEDIDKWVASAKIIIQQWDDELKRAKKEWARFGKPGELANDKIGIKSEKLISSLEKNINMLEEYKKFPEKFLKYMTWKERYMAQILCNVQIITDTLGGWIYDNGKRFKAWVELIILIKAILKSWQLIIDLFKDYKASCSTCKNERGDLIDFIFKLISAVIPQIPIIQFPKWPDIVLDLHNIRAGLKVLMPEFNFQTVPIVLPQLPTLHLPDIPNINLSLPAISELPKIPELPDLPDIPSLPSIKLPNLPPPPTIPKLFGFIEAFLGILKLIAKIMCVLRSNPLIPEWRAGDQISFITERTGTLPMDFISLDFPQYSYPWVDAIKVTTYVNLEFEIQFILEMAKSTFEPFNRFTNNIANIGKKVSVPSIDLRGTIPKEINVNVGPQGYDNKNEMMKKFNNFSFVLLKDLLQLVSYIDNSKKEELVVSDFKRLLGDNIKNFAFSSNSKEKLIFSELDKAIKYSGQNEDKFIQELADNSKNKFKIVKDYVNLESHKTQLQIAELNKIIREGRSIQDFSPLVKFKNGNIKVNSNFSTDLYKQELKEKLDNSNKKIIGSIENINNLKNNPIETDINNAKLALLTDINSGLSSFTKDMKENEIKYQKNYTDSTQKLLALNDSNINSASSNASSASDSMYSFNYDGIYVLDSNGKQSRLFNYTDEIDGEEQIVEIDYDLDKDQDTVYRIGNNLYLKQNLKNNPNINVSSDISEYNASDIDDRIGINGDITKVLAAPNYFQEYFKPSSNYINFSFSPANFILDNKFRFEYYDYINRFDKMSAGELSKNIIPETKTNYVDLIPDLSTDTITNTSTGFTTRKNIAFFDSGVGEGFIKWQAFKTLESGNGILIQSGKRIYVNQNGAKIEYKEEGSNENYETLNLSPNSNLEFNSNTQINVLQGKIYLFYDYSEKKNIDLSTLKGIPVLPGTYLESLNQNSYFNIGYFDDSRSIIDGSASYEYYNLGIKEKDYTVSLNRDNDFYYGKLYSFGDGKTGTVTSLSLLSPQLQADTEAPLISLAKSIRIPVYQKQIINLQSYINDLSSISEIYVDGDLTLDSDKDGIADNDKDSLNLSNTYKIKKGDTIYDLKFGPFDNIFTKNIKLFVKDENDNLGSKDISLEVYSPVPEITSISGSIIGGTISEKLKDEPVDIFRLRDGILERIILDNINSFSGITDISGKYNYKTSSTGSGINLQDSSGLIIGKINERTGKIDLQNSSYQINILGASENNKTQIQVIDKNNSNAIFYESINLISNNILQQIDNFDDNTVNGIYFKLLNSSFSFIKNSSSDPSLPNGGYIINDSNKAIIGISTDGNVYLLDESYTLSYSTYNNYVIFKILDSDGNSIGEILFKINSEYILK